MGDEPPTTRECPFAGHTRLRAKPFSRSRAGGNDDHGVLADALDALGAGSVQLVQRRGRTEFGTVRLGYDDLLDPLNSLDIEEALKRLPQKEVEARNARLKRAMDLNFKHAELPPEIQALQDPFKPYLSPYVEQVKAENAERAAVGAGKPYDRQLP